MKPVFLAAILITCLATVHASDDDRRRRRVDPREQGPAIDAKMEYRMRAARAEKAHAELRATAKELTELSIDLSKRLEQGASLDDEDGKTLDQIKRLAKKVRSEFGGSGDPDFQNPPRTIPDAAACLAERARTLADEMKTASRYEINAKLINLTGEMMMLTDILRHLGGV